MLEKLFGNKIKKSVADTDIENITSALDRYDRIFRGIRGYGFLDWDLEAQTTHWHGGFWSYLGYDEEQINKIADATTFLQFIHPDDRQNFSENIVKIIKNQRRKDLIFRIQSKYYEYIWVELRLDAVRAPNGRVSYLSGVIFDVSALKETEEALKVSEARYARIIQASNDGIWEWSLEYDGQRKPFTGDDGWEGEDQKGSFSFSRRCWEMIGYSADEDVAKFGLVAWRKLMHEEDVKRFDKVLSDHMFKRTPFEIEYRMRCKNGDWRWILGRGQMSYDEAGRFNILSGTNMDITAVKHAEERVVRAKEEAEKASQAKSEFLSSMSHELRTPLNAILGFAQLFEMDSSISEQQRGNIREIKSAGKHLLELIGDVLDLAKIEAGHLTLSLERVIPSRIIKECATLLQAQIKKNQLNFEIEFNGLETQAIYADAMRLKQVFLNLIGNATKYNEKDGKVLIELSMQPNKRMKIMVIDSGYGIPHHLQGQLYQPFNRLGAERSDIEGSGVGLVITKQLVEQMGGEIDFCSEENVGSQFWVEFPIAGEDFVDNLHFEGTVSSEDVVDNDIPVLVVKETKKILYVEDNPSNQKLLQQVLAKFPVLNLTVVGLAVQGLYLARSMRPDLIILDVNLPGISGYEIVEILKQDPVTQNIPVIALSANVLVHDIKKGRQAGFDYYLTKPLNLGELISLCNLLLT